MVVGGAIGCSPSEVHALLSLYEWSGEWRAGDALCLSVLGREPASASIECLDSTSTAESPTIGLERILLVGLSAGYP